MARKIKLPLPAEKENKRDKNIPSRTVRYKQVDRLQIHLKIKFKDRNLLLRALTHRSFVNEYGPDTKDNERLEYLGDSVLGLVVNEYLFKHFGEYPEGSLAKIKSAAVSEATLSKVACDLDLGQYIFMGKGEEHNGGRERPSILANTLEAVIGALYLDLGLKACRGFILNLLKDDIERIDGLTYLRDPKTTLQEYVQKKYKDRPIYDVVSEKGPDHNKIFEVNLVVAGRVIASGEGSSKRKAEMCAAREALKRIAEGGSDV